MSFRCVAAAESSSQSQGASQKNLSWHWQNYLLPLFGHSCNSFIFPQRLKCETTPTAVAHLHRHRRQRPPSDGGFSLTEAMVSSVLLMLVVSQSAGLFSQSLNALGKARLRDSVNAAIAADLEQVRHEVFTWAANTTASVDGQLSYSPIASACNAGTLASALLTDRSATLPAQSSVTSHAVPGISIRRTITVDPSDTNVLLVRYSTSGSNLVTVDQNTALVPPAQGWCP